MLQENIVSIIRDAKNALDQRRRIKSGIFCGLRRFLGCFPHRLRFCLP